MSAGLDMRAVPLLARGRIHPWQHFDARGAIIGRVTDAGGYEAVTSDGNIIPAEALKAELLFGPADPQPWFAGRWSDAEAAAWCEARVAPSFSAVLALLRECFRTLLELPRPEWATALAVWTLGTYFHMLFLAYPRFALAGEAGCGKSKLLEVMGLTAFNAVLGLEASAAALFRLIAGYRPTWLLDEMENMADEERRAALSILRAGYKRGGCVPRVEGDRVRRVAAFPIYGPAAIAAIREAPAAMKTRCIGFTMLRGTDRGRINAEVDPCDPAFARIRDGAYRLALGRWEEVQSALTAVRVPIWLNARTRELWRPLLTIAHAADQEVDAWDVRSDLLKLVRDDVADRDAVAPEGDALFAELGLLVVEGRAVTIRPGELGEPLRVRLGWKDAPTPERVGGWLRRYGFPKDTPPKDDRGARYALTRRVFDDVLTRYAPPPLDTDGDEAVRPG